MTTSTSVHPAPTLAGALHVSRHQRGVYHNVAPKPPLGFWTSLKLTWRFLFAKPAGTVPDRPIPVHALSRTDLLAAPDHSLYRLGHSTLLFKLGGRFILTDPVFCQRASPVQWAGPARFHAAPISCDDLPPIDVVLLSHNHYDHLDRSAIRALTAKTRYFVTPLGVGDQLIGWDVPANKVRQLDWWQSVMLDGVNLVATPAQHFSGRGLFDADKTLWASWVISDERLRLFFSGDSGYFGGFDEIGRRFGPFDLTLLETGAYDEHWPFVHMTPEETLQAHRDLRGRCLLPIHNGTFDLALHPWHEPFERIASLAQAAAVPLSTPEMGERVDLHAPHGGREWWRS